VVKEIVRGAHELGIQWLTLFAFSTENWDRPREEVDATSRSTRGRRRAGRGNASAWKRRPFAI
jgi:undecaprenyl diphosphate synthase